jgi:CDP-diacylglycerol---glycerol-3-phosphate 3-phosphatidyltransferase
MQVKAYERAAVDLIQIAADESWRNFYNITDLLDVTGRIVVSQMSKKSNAINFITVSRVLLLACGFLLSLSGEYFFVISVWAAFSDFIDGYLARKYSLTSRLGEQLDQITDKIFHIGMFLYLLQSGFIHLIFVSLFILREGLILFLRWFNRSQKTSNFHGKLKTFLTYTFIIVVLGDNQAFKTLWTTPAVTLAFEFIILAISYYSLVYSVNLKSVKK